MSDIAIAGHNSSMFGQDEPRARPNKITPEQELEFAKLAERAAIILASLFRVPKKRVIGKRQGDEGLIIRRVLFRYLRGRDCPIKLMAKIFDLDRGAPGADADAMELWEARNETLDTDMESIADGLDKLLTVKPRRFVRLCMTEIEADRAAAKAVKVVTEAREALDRPTPTFAPVKSPEQIARAAEAERLVAQGQDKARRAYIATQVQIHAAVIAAGEREGATKDQRTEAKRARLALEAIGAEIKSKKKAAKT